MKAVFVFFGAILCAFNFKVPKKLKRQNICIKNFNSDLKKTQNFRRVSSNPMKK
jgi:hypothetical protein